MPSHDLSQGLPALPSSSPLTLTEASLCSLVGMFGMFHFFGIQ